jgi:hypothetical protein
MTIFHLKRMNKVLLHRKEDKTIRKETIEITWRKLLEISRIPLFQREEDSDHTEDIVNFELRHFERYGTFLFPGIITLAHNIDDLTLENEKDQPNSKDILDGQHRTAAIKRLSEMNPFYLNETISICIIYGTSDYLFDIYNKINMNKKVDIVLRRNEAEIISRTCDLISKKYSKFISKSLKPNRPNINIDSFRTAIQNTKIIQRLKLEVPDDLISKINELNSWYGTCNPSEFKKWGIRGIDVLSTCTKKVGIEEKKFFLGLYNRHFEFLHRIIERYEERISYNEQSHGCISSCVPVPSKMRDELWRSHFGDTFIGSCKCCNQKIDMKKDYEAGHIISQYNGGKTRLNNLIPLCSECNRDMGITNYEEFKERFYSDEE